MPAAAARAGPASMYQQQPMTSTAVAPRRSKTPVADRPGRLATPGRRKGAGAPLMQDNLVQAAYHTDADQYRRPQQQPTRALAGHGHLPGQAARRPRPHTEGSAPPELVATDHCVPARTCTRPPQERPVKLSSTPPRCLRRWRPPCSASEPTCPSPGASPSLVRAVGALSSLRAPGGTATAVPVNAQRPASSARSLGRHRCEGQQRI